MTHMDLTASIPHPAEDSPIERWLAQRRKAIFAAILLLSVIVRICAFLDLSRGPCFWQHKWQDTDMRTYDEWARDIAAGDWLSVNMHPPYNEWHREVANAYFRLYPARREVLAQGGIDPARALWDTWSNGRSFYQAPIYPYFMAVIYRLFTPDVRWVLAFQLLLGVAGVALAYTATQRCFGHLVACIAGVMIALCGPILFFEFMLLRETLLVFIGWVLVTATLAAMRKGTVLSWWCVGIVIGLACLAKSVFSFFLGGLLAMLFILYRGQKMRVFVLSAGVVLAGVALCLGCMAARNAAVGAPIMGTPNGVFPLIAGNARGASPQSGLAIDPSIVARLMEETGGRVGAALIPTIRTHDSFADYLGLLWKKFTVMWGWYEIPNVVNFYYYRLYSPTLRHLPVTFLIVAPLGIIGLLLALPRWRACWPLYLLCAAHLIPLMIIQTLSRYRIPLMAAMIPFAAYTLGSAIEGVRTRNRRTIGLVAVTLLLSIWTGWPVPAARDMIRPVDYVAPFDFYTLPRLHAAANAGDWATAVGLVRDFLAHEPERLSMLGESHPARDADDLSLARSFSKIHAICADVFREAGMSVESARHAERARQLEAAASSADGAGRESGQ